MRLVDGPAPPVVAEKVLKVASGKGKSLLSDLPLPAAAGGRGALKRRKLH